MASNETIKQAVMAGMGIAFISAHTCGLELEAHRLVPLAVAGTPVLRQWFVVRRAEKRMLPALNDFVNFLRDEGAQHIQAHCRVLPPVATAPRRSHPEKGVVTR